MGITRDRGRYYFVLRVPKRFEGVVVGKDGKPVSQVRKALFTDSRNEALAKAKQVEAATMAQWEALVAGDEISAHRHYMNARKIAETRGFTYRPMDEIATGDLHDLVRRILATQKGATLVPSEIASAIMGTVPESSPTLTEIFEEYRGLTSVDRREKSEAQAKRWESLRCFAVDTFNRVLIEAGRCEKDPPLSSITRADVLAYRSWWAARVEAGEVTPGAANKHIGILSTIVGEWAKLTGVRIENPFRNLRLTRGKENRKPAFSPEWIKTHLLAPGALDALNDEARDVFLMMINTGLRPSEITDAPRSDFEVDAPIPFFRVAPNGRELKVAHTARDVPLLGVSLAAAKRIAARGGIARYAHKSNSWSAAVTKHLRVHELQETPQHTPYSLRHSVEDALQRSGADDRIRADILGHKYARPRYGDGGALVGRREALEKIAYPAPAAAPAPSE
ncbi:integrase [Defluviimonas sp. 20V17]|uniref:Integrase n=1 Tax=Allgaiera indica TaxID=765699 RepID=A0AAN4USV1_9RHOB|nr:DUF6538 domain-containing protein [Allgaiera indica]KDB04621.1 integrase [Defluviimonas sp. 20V17]GHE03722.1 integrase [Allgaiera indica]SDX73861.1 Site-specific recombinase XerD [Allgaiera indica]